MNNNPDKDPIEELLEPLAQKEQRHRAPQQLRAQILQRVHEAAVTQTDGANATSSMQHLIDWLTERWWRGVSIGATAAAIPLLSGVLVGAQLSPTEEALDDPADAWLASYAVATEINTSPLPNGDYQ
ncbi:MAG: hypothetical protein ACR2PZ_16200 [Pseudomonadales bacterium]